MMARKQEYIRWGVIGECGLYVGQRQTRKDAIAEHVSMLYGVSPYVQGALDEGQREAWDICRKKGDRAVKLKIIIQKQRRV